MFNRSFFKNISGFDDIFTIRIHPGCGYHVIEQTDPFVDVLRSRKDHFLEIIPKPILFSSDMVHSLISGDKTETRRLVRFPKSAYMPDTSWIRSMNKLENGTYIGTSSPWTSQELKRLYGPETGTVGIKPPYNVGDILYVRESYLLCIYDDFLEGMNSRIVYKASINKDWYSALREAHPQEHWTPSIHMQKQFARIFLKVTDVYVQRLHEMLSRDFYNEGIIKNEKLGKFGYGLRWQWDDNFLLNEQTPELAFQKLWDRTSSKDSWQTNPWVWVIKFQRVV